MYSIVILSGQATVAIKHGKVGEMLLSEIYPGHWIVKYQILHHFSLSIF